MRLFVLPNLYVTHNTLVLGELLQVFDKGSKLEQEVQINAADLDYLLLMVVVTAPLEVTKKTPLKRILRLKLMATVKSLLV